MCAGEMRTLWMDEKSPVVTGAHSFEGLKRMMNDIGADVDILKTRDVIDQLTARGVQLYRAIELCVLARHEMCRDALADVIVP